MKTHLIHQRAVHPSHKGNFITIRSNIKKQLRGFAALAAIMSTTTQAQSWDWSYSYKTVFSANALDNIVELINMKRTSEGNITYWNPINNNQDARLTKKFIFSKPIVASFLNIDYIYVANFSDANYGSGSLWGSKNGVDWVQLINAPRPSEIAAGYNYSESLPESLMGTNELWLQARLNTQGWNIMAQFLRYGTSERTNNAFDLKVNYGNTLISGGINGVVTGGGIHPLNATAILSATPNPGYLFTGWTGDATGFVNPLSVLMDADKTITATFTPDTNDDDGDGLTNYEEIVIYGTDPNNPDTDGDGLLDGYSITVSSDDPRYDAWPERGIPFIQVDTQDDAMRLFHGEITMGTDPLNPDTDGDGLTDGDEVYIHGTNPRDLDSDGDGLSDWEEVNIYGTDPLNPDTDGDGFLDGYEVLTGKSPLDPNDKPALVAEVRTAIELSFPAAIGKTYRIEDSLDLATWETVESGIAGNGGVIQRFYSTRNVPKRYFRVEEDGQ